MAPRHYTYQVLLEWDSQDKVWVSYVPDLNYLSTYGATRAEAIANTEEAILGYIEAAQKEGFDVPSGTSEAELVAVEISVA